MLHAVDRTGVTQSVPGVKRVLVKSDMKPTGPLCGPLTRTSLADSAYEAILDAILSGRLAAGDEVSEVSLATELGISRTPVTQAVQKLAAVGLLERSGGKQPRVARFNRAEVVEIYEMRELLEGEAAARAATRFSPKRLEELRAEADKLVAAPRGTGWVERALQFDLDFHDELAVASGNRRLCEQIRVFRLLVRAFCRNTGRRENLVEAMAEHREILTALAQRSASQARSAMSRHIQRRQAVVLKELYPEQHSS
jgi:DNA-binding GntR family transcriptional regulator